jgi:asparagine synthase (glutamine-hydrolysing)
MCGIAGIVSFNESGAPWLEKINLASSCLALRGPDAEGFYRSGNIAFAHRRLSVIDTSDAANQPMSDSEGRFNIVFNGEFFNYKEHRER